MKNRFMTYGLGLVVVAAASIALSQSDKEAPGTYWELQPYLWKHGQVSQGPNRPMYHPDPVYTPQCPYVFDLYDVDKCVISNIKHIPEISTGTTMTETTVTPLLPVQSRR